MIPIVDSNTVQPIEMVQPVQMIFQGPDRTLGGSVLKSWRNESV